MAAVDHGLTVSALEQLGLDPRFVRGELEAMPEDTDAAQEVAGMVLESAAGILLDPRKSLQDSVVELVDAFRRAGVPCRLDSAEGAPVLVVEDDARARAHRINLGEELSHEGLVESVVRLLPAGFTIRLCPAAAHEGAYPVVVLAKPELAALEEAFGGADALREVLPTPPPVRVHATVAAIAIDNLDPVDWSQRYREIAVATDVPDWRRIWDPLKGHDPRAAWPADAERPPGDDFYALTMALSGPPLARCIEDGDAAAWANLAYRWALASYVGSRWDVLACRLNPGASAQGVLGFGQLNWAYFIFEALGASEEASRVASLLQVPLVLEQERAAVAVRQPAWFDLGSFMRDGERGPQLLRVREFVALADADAWTRPEVLNAALKLYTEPRGDQLTHHPLYQAWPAPLYALARRAGALDDLSKENPYLGNAARLDDVDMEADLVVGLKRLESGLEVTEAAGQPALLDPLPVIVEVRVREVRDGFVHGTTMLGGDGGEHAVQAPPGEVDPQPGEIWSMRIDDGRRGTATETDTEAGTTLRYRIAIPTGEWLDRVG